MILFQKYTRKLASCASRTLFQKKRSLSSSVPVVSFTFDDVPSSAVQRGAEILERYEARGTFYASLGLLGQESSVGRLSEKRELLELESLGHEIGCHTFRHVDVRTTPLKALKADISENQTYAEQLGFKNRLDNFSYPFGSVSLFSKPFLGKRFRSCRGIESGVNATQCDLSLLRANRLYGTVLDRDWLASLITECLQRNGWLVFYTHDVGPDPSPFGCSAELLEEVVSSVRDASLPILPVREVVG